MATEAAAPSSVYHNDQPLRGRVEAAVSRDFKDLSLEHQPVGGFFDQDEVFTIVTIYITVPRTTDGCKCVPGGLF